MKCMYCQGEMKKSTAALSALEEQSKELIKI